MARLNLIFSAFGTALLSMTLAACGGTSSTPTPPPINVGGGGNAGSGAGGGAGVSNGGAGTGGGGYVLNTSTGGSPSATCSGTQNSGCKAQAAEGCGDGINNQNGIEACDDGNTLPGDGCNGACHVEKNWTCPKDATQGKCTKDVICGDGTVGAGEVCDDKNTIDNDGCNSTCTVQDPAFTCVAGEACVRVSQCGNKRIEAGENCDDGQATPTSGDGCSASCQLEAGWVCPKPGQPCKVAPSCGDGIVSAALGEVCDDGNTKDGDGCSGNCKVKGAGCVCSPGKICSCPTIACGNGKVEGNEACDDGNTKAGDGCSADCSTVESGYTCPFSDAPCVPDCGDGIVLAPMEQCDPGVKATNMDKACTSTCKWADGWACTGTPVNCHQTKCGDGKPEGTEGCDDGNTAPGDGCSPTCHAEPSCSAATGTCTSKCGDGIVMPAQPDGPVMPGGACDDGNSASGDGCSADCKVEAGFQCEQPPQTSPTMTVPLVARDFNAGGDFEPSATGKHVAVPGLVQSTLDAEGKPVLASGATSNPDGYMSGNSFATWYRDGSTVNFTKKTTLTLHDNGNGGYVNWLLNGKQWVGYGNIRWCADTACTNCNPYNGTSVTGCNAGVTCQCFHPCTLWTGSSDNCIADLVPSDGDPVFFPVDDAPTHSPWTVAQIPPPYGNWEDETSKANHNFSFTTEVRYWFGYVSSKKYTLDFMGDDDVWVFINRKLAVDIGGIHTPVSGTITLNSKGGGTVTVTQITDCGGTGTACATSTKTVDLGMQDGGVYEIALFQAERQTKASTYKLTLSGFNDQASQCKPICGDGVVSPGEQCDNGADNTGGYNKCTADCLLGPYCGDALVDPDNEQCDNGKNDSDRGSDNGCAPGCKLPSSCGDGSVQTEWGEDCDLGANNVAPNADGSAPYGADVCTTSCLAGGYCGDGVTNGPETCDDGANDGTYGTCNPDCTPAPKCGDGNVDADYGEECEPDPNISGEDPNCTKGCRLPGGCGDGKIQAPEQCDEGELFNNGDYGGCAPSCIYAQRCGDGIKNGPEAVLDAQGNVVTPAAEECDDGVWDSSYGGCTPQCKLGPHCGDNIVNGPETCDHGAQNGKDDLCTASCKIIQYVPA